MASPESPQPSSSLTRKRSRAACAGVRSGSGDLERVEAELAVAVEHLPEHRVRRDHVGRIRQPVELHAGGPHHLLGELVGLIANRVFSLAELALDVDERHGRLL